MTREYQIEGVYVQETGEDEYQVETVYLNEAVAPLALPDYSWEDASPYNASDSEGTVVATGGTAPYTYSPVSLGQV